MLFHHANVHIGRPDKYHFSEIMSKPPGELMRIDALFKKRITKHQPAQPPSQALPLHLYT